MKGKDQYQQSSTFVNFPPISKSYHQTIQKLRIAGTSCKEAFRGGFNTTSARTSTTEDLHVGLTQKLWKLPLKRNQELSVQRSNLLITSERCFYICLCLGCQLARKLFWKWLSGALLHCPVLRSVTRQSSHLISGGIFLIRALIPAQLWRRHSAAHSHLLFLAMVKKLIT